MPATKMSTEIDHAREIAERIARRVAGDNPRRIRNQTARRTQPKPELTSELAAVRAGLSELQRKIAQLEAKVSSTRNGSPRALLVHLTPRQPVPAAHARYLQLTRPGLPASMLRFRIPVWKSLALKKQSSRNSLTTSRKKRPAAWNPAANPATIARCAARAASDRSYRRN